ncbi:hypothetical protein NEUTE1DRAFT_36127 [Neurospora tetrasperma FGSC 2508]|uniref:Uncharacterized protein n=1 Tax=Neurospora tetrasperma (strain FGSC 2508 / ATCC MYA-4615 / P0657) TaxID=510951 RepID=F8MEJ0_NEUT8|nr:uncharacterized protein NEUTE1DRAFT_36127 [Neurospora tetrasperma FGSC 2508]EGO60821.1 hypothetical protein NEUTE1DRAFT_36127 [Neurospora tetrasperma FGSC 2508]EGZ75189.1 hypothetical protein NEUTE2DRAFT_56681 [Neurospora tetrasperma FGSC 2509]
MRDVCQRRPCLVLWLTASYCRSEGTLESMLLPYRSRSSEEEIFGEGKIPKRYSPVKLGYTQTGYDRDSARLSLVPGLQPDLYLSALNAGVIKW